MTFDHFKIVPLASEDFGAYYALIDSNRKRLEDFFAGTVAYTDTPENARQHLDRMLQKTLKKEYFAFALVDLQANKWAGYLDLKNIDWHLPKAEMGCFIDASYEGQGISTKALQQLIKHCFNDMGFNKLFLRTHESNMGSRKLAEKCGFEVEGVLRKDYKTSSGQFVDLMYYGLLRDSL